MDIGSALKSADTSTAGLIQKVVADIQAVSVRIVAVLCALLCHNYAGTVAYVYFVLTSYLLPNETN